MNEPASYRIDDNCPAGALSVGQLRELIRAAVNEALGATGRYEEERLNIRQAAAKIGLSPDWIYRHKSKLPFVLRVGSRKLLFSKQGIENWMNSQKVGSWH